MARTLTGPFTSEIQTAQNTEPVTLVHVLFPSGDKYYADKVMSLGGRDYEEKIIGINDVVSQGKVDTLGSIATGSLTLDDSDGALKALVDTDILEGADVEVYQWFEGLADGDKLLLIKGKVSSPILWDEGERTLTFSIETPITDDKVGFAPTEADLAGIHPDAVGVPWPICFGNPIRVPAVQVFKAIEGTTRDPETFASADSIYVNNGRDFPQSTTITIGVEALNAYNPVTRERQRFIVFFEGSFSGDVFTATIKNKIVNSNVGLDPRVATDPDFANPSVCWIDDPSIDLVHQFCYIDDAGNPLVNFCWKQEGTKCYFRKPWKREGNNPNILLSDVVQGSIDETAGSVRTSWGADFLLESKVFDDAGNVDRVITTGVFFRDSWDLPPGARVFYDDGNPPTYVANLAESNAVVEVMARRKLNEEDTEKTLVPIPQSYFTINLNTTLAGKTVTTIVFDRQLSLRLYEEWDDEIFVTLRSTLSQNTADAIKYLIDTYSVLGSDAGSFASVATDLTNFPSHFAILDQPNTLAVCEDIAWQARCALLVKNDTVHIRYLSKVTTETHPFDNSDTEFKSLSHQYTPTEDLVTRLIAKWRDNYVDDFDEYQFELNINNYGLIEEERQFFIYNIESLVKVSAGFWGYRWSNSWRQAGLRGYYNSIALEAFDVFAVDISQLSTNKIRGEIERATQNISEDVFSYFGTLASKAGDVDGGNQPNEDLDYFRGDPNNPADPAPAAPADPTAGMGLTDYTIEPFSPDPTSPNPDTDKQRRVLEILDVPDQVKRNTNFEITVVLKDYLDHDIIETADVDLEITSTDPSDVVNPSVFTITNGRGTGNIQIQGGTGSDTATLRALLSDTDSKVSKAFSIDPVGKPVFTLFPELVIRDNLFRVEIEGGTPSANVTVTMFSDDATGDNLYDAADVAVASVTLDGSGNFSGQWKLKDGTDEITTFRIELTEGGFTSSSPKTTVFEIDPANLTVQEDVIGANSFADGQLVRKPRSGSPGNTWLAISSFSDLIEDDIVGIVFNRTAGDYSVCMRGLVPGSVPGVANDYSTLFIDNSGAKSTTKFVNSQGFYARAAKVLGSNSLVWVDYLYRNNLHGHIIEDEGTPLTQRSTINFTGAGVTVTDTGGKTTVDVPGGGGGGAAVDRTATASGSPNIGDAGFFRKADSTIYRFTEATKFDHKEDVPGIIISTSPPNATLRTYGELPGGLGYSAGTTYYADGASSVAVSTIYPILMVEGNIKVAIKLFEDEFVDPEVRQIDGSTDLGNQGNGFVQNDFASATSQIAFTSVFPLKSSNRKVKVNLRANYNDDTGGDLKEATFNISMWMEFLDNASGVKIRGFSTFQDHLIRHPTSGSGHNSKTNYAQVSDIPYDTFTNLHNTFSSPFGDTLRVQCNPTDTNITFRATSLGATSIQELSIGALIIGQEAP